MKVSGNERKQEISLLTIRGIFVEIRKLFVLSVKKHL